MKESFQNKDGEWVHPAGAAILLGVTVRTLRNWRRSRMVNGKIQLPPIPSMRQPNGTHRYRVSDIKAFIAAAQSKALTVPPQPDWFKEKK